MSNKLKLTATLILAFTVFSCGGDLINLKEIQKQKAGDYNVSILNTTGEIKQGSGSFVIEFRNVSDNQLAKVENITSSAVMQMQGTPMTGVTTVKVTDIPGSYDVKYNFPMKGNWIIVITFGKGLQARFNLNVI